ncbi:hypothetical protein D9G60_22125 [Escherichia coli]|nr:hypothetical protein [Escherichia coli]
MPKQPCASGGKVKSAAQKTLKCSHYHPLAKTTGEKIHQQQCNTTEQNVQRQRRSLFRAAPQKMANAPVNNNLQVSR